MNSTLNTLRSYAAGATEAIAETLWPTRCAICDTPGEVLCDVCKRHLPYLDWWRACEHCGAPFGRVQCSECNPIILERAGRAELPYNGCASAVVFDDKSARIARAYKDHGERRLALTMAELMQRAVPPEWIIDTTTFIPASSAAFRRRGFDHTELLAQHLSTILERPYLPLLHRPRSRDQRKLSGVARMKNMTGRFEAISDNAMPRRVLLVDDVYTTGATLFDATDALKEAGVEKVCCLTYARVW